MVTEDRVIYNWPLWKAFGNKVAEMHADQEKFQQELNRYIGALPTAYIPTTTYTWDQETKDRMTIELPHKPLWQKTRQCFVDNTETFEEREHDANIDAGWNYLRICWSPNPPLSSVQLKVLNDSSIQHDDNEGIQRRFEELTALYGSKTPKVIYGVSVLENVEEEIKRAYENLELRRAMFEDLTYIDKMNNIKTSLMQFYENEDKTEEEEDEPLPPQIKNKPERSEELLDEWHLKNPPKLRRQRNIDHPLEEMYAETDKRLEWLMLTVEEEDNEEKNQETFGL